MQQFSLAKVGLLGTILIAGNWLCHAQESIQAPSATTPTKEPKAPEKLLSLRFENVSVRELLKMLGEQGEQKILISDDIAGEIRYFNIKDKTFERALSTVTQIAGLSWGKAGETYLVTKTAPRVQGLTGGILNSAPQLHLVPIPGSPFKAQPHSFLIPKDGQPLPSIPQKPGSALPDAARPNWKSFDFNGMDYYLVPLTPALEANKQTATPAR